MKVLIIDSDKHWVEMLNGWLKVMGYDVRRAHTGEQAKCEWTEQQPDIVLLDPDLHNVDALAMCRQLRIIHDALILVMTEDKGVEHEISCLESGADDYLRKPMFPSQLLARIHTLSRRTRSTLKQRPSSVLTLGPLKFDSLNNTVIIGGKTTRLTPTESKLLYLLATNDNYVCTAEQIVSYVWGYDGDSFLIKAHIRHLRVKIEADPGRPRFIRTVPGVGYKFVSTSAQKMIS